VAQYIFPKVDYRELVEAKTLISYKTSTSIVDCGKMYFREFMMTQKIIYDIEETKINAMKNGT
jgi:phage antirepressor YoqD-like protein